MHRLREWLRTAVAVCVLLCIVAFWVSVALLYLPIHLWKDRKRGKAQSKP